MRKRKCWRMIIQCTNLRVRSPQIDFSCIFHLAVFVFWKHFVYQKFWKKIGIVTSKYACNSATFVVLAVLIKYNWYFQVESKYNKQPSLNSCTRILMYLKMHKVFLILPSWYKGFLKENYIKILKKAFSTGKPCFML